MKLYVFSDLHNEFDRFEPPEIEPPEIEADVVVLARDRRETLYQGVVSENGK